MKKFIVFVPFAIVAMFTFLPGCGPWETVDDKGAVCHKDSDCPEPLVCGDTPDGKKNVCITITERCNNGLKDGGESAIDCGFACRESAPPNLCPAGQTCENNADCDGTKGLTCNNGVCRTATTPPVCTSNNDCSGGAKVCFTTYCGDCVNNAQCGSGKECKSGSCVAVSGDCNGGCSSGYVCVDNACLPGNAQNYLCATPQVALTLTCWNQATGGVIDTTYTVAANQRVCCPVASGSFTTDPYTTSGTYTGYKGTDVVQPFRSWTNNLGQAISGGYK